ncbi:MAG TPA: DUF1553 domain-containing protein [Planctomycetota bacterium]|nr:DUF1553 domain-containing protein [Planctomycetota bacterium]
MIRKLVLFAAVVGTAAGTGVSQESAAKAAPDFVRDVLPLFKEHCWSCHGPTKQKGGLRLDLRSRAVAGGAAGPAFVPGRGATSRLVELLRSADAEERMPLKAPALPPDKIALISAWIDAGAVWPDTAAGAERSAPHWAYVKPVRAEPPRNIGAGWVRNPVDAFVAAEHEAHGLKPRPEAPRPVLLRRLYLDLIGLPPTRDELQAFLADASPDAYEKVVDRLLADPRHGERWARHWMDVWRYSDMSEFEANQILASQRHLWRWRDWIIAAVNADKAYDRMIVEMLAGDEVAPLDPDTVRATGFLARNYYKLNRNVWLDQAVEHTSKAFMATTLNCARCHNHMFDPISQQEYYQVRAFYEPYEVRTDPVPGESDPVKDGLARVYDAYADAPTYLFVRGEDRSPDTSRALPPEPPKSLGGKPISIRPRPVPDPARVPGKQDFVRADLLKAAEREIAQARTKADAVQDSIAKLQAAAAADGQEKSRRELQVALEELPSALRAIPLAEAKLASLRATLEAERAEDAKSEALAPAAREAQSAQRLLALLDAQRARSAAARVVVAASDDKKRADARKKLADAEAALAKAEAESGKPLTGDFVRRKIDAYPGSSTGRRSALAAWIADPENPLTARVAVNHVWMRHFGRALVPTVFDFGTQGQRPSHPALLDWLAVEFMRGGWSLKALHRVIVTSATYRMDSTPDAAALAADPEDKYLWRMAPRRLEAEAVRDSTLYCCGRLDPAGGGPELDHQQGLASRRRSLYFRHNPEKRMEFLAIFDGAGATECYSRTHTIVPQQALAMLNSAIALDGADVLAKKLSEKETEPAAFVSAAFETVLSRAPSEREREECATFLSAGDSLRGRSNLIHVLLNHHEFVTIR